MSISPLILTPLHNAAKILTLMEPAFFWDSQNRGGVDINPPPCYLCPGASGRLVLNMTIVGYPLKIFLRYITFL